MSNQLGFVIKFVVTTNCRREQIQNAARGVQAANVPTEKIKGDAVLKMTKRDDNVYVCDPFEGPAFKHLLSLGCRIVGAQCVLSCLDKDHSLPKVNHPVHNLSLYGAIITCSSIAKEKREWIHEKVHWMGGNVSKDLTECITHLVVGEVGSKKYHVAADLKKPILLTDWVEACWEEGQTKHFNGTDQKVVSLYKCPAFKGCNVCVTGFQMKEKKNILNIITKNGGIYSKELKFKESTHLIVGAAKGPKYEYAKKWKVHCVSIQWLFDGLEKGYSQDETLYPPDKSEGSPKRHTSTPVKDGSRKSVTGSKGFNISTISNISNLSSVDETAMTTFNMTGVKGQAIPQAERVVKVTIEEGLKALEELQLNQASSEPFLDGCKIYLSGFTADLVEKLRRVINSGGGTRLSQLNEAVTHILVGESVMQEVKRFHAKMSETYILNVMWLIESYKTHQRQSERLYILPQFGKDETLVQQVQQTTKVKARPPVVTDENPPESILNQYLPHAEVDKEDVTMMEEDPSAKEEKDADADETVMEPEVKGAIFADKIFTVVGFTSADTEEIQSEIMDAQGKIVMEGSRAIPDFAVVPLEGCEVQRTVGEVVTICWLEMCLEAEKFLPTFENFLFKPFIINTTSKPLTDSVLSFSQYSAVEKGFLTQVASNLGAVCQDYFMRNPKKDFKGNTHLVLEIPSGSKYDAAKMWNIPAVTKEWLLQCAKKGKKLPEESFLVDGATKPIDPVEMPPGTSREASPEIPVAVDNLRVNHLNMDVDVTPKENLPQSDAFKTPNLGRLTLNSVKRPCTDSGDKHSKRRKRGEGRSSVEDTPSTPGKFLKSNQGFHPRFSFGDMDLQQTPASETVKKPHRRKSSLPQEIYLYQNLVTAVENTRGGAHDEEMDDGKDSVFEKDPAKLQSSSVSQYRSFNGSPWFIMAQHPLKPVAETGVLHGLVICISKSLAHSHGDLSKIVQCLGGNLQYGLDESCTHYVFQGKTSNANREYRKARKSGVCIVSPEWLYACKEANRRLDEKLYPHTVNPNMSLSLSQAPVNDSVLGSRKESPPPAEVDPVSPHPPHEAAEGGLGDDLSMEEEQLMIAEADAIEDKENSGSTDEQREEFQRQFAEIMATSGNSDSAKRRGRRQLRSSNGNSKDGSNTAMENRRSSRRLTRSRRESNMTSPLSKKNSEEYDSETFDKCVITWDDDTSRVCRENAIARLRREDVKNDDSSKLEEEDEDQRKAAVKEFTEQGNFQSAHPVDLSPSPTTIGPPIRLPCAKPAVAPPPEEEDQSQKNSPPKKVFLFTGLTPQERIDYGALIEQLGGEVADKPYYNTNCTHMIVGSPTRNEKYLAAVASGRWILHRSYMVECQKAGHFIDEEPHELNSSMFSRKMSSSSLSLCDAPKRWREQLQSEEKEHKGAFDGWKVLLLVDEKRVAGLKRILEAGCGTVLNTRCPFSASAMSEATHFFLNSSNPNVPEGAIDFETIVSSGTLCLKPDYIVDFLIKVPSPDPSSYLIADVKPILERLANDTIQATESTARKRKTRDSSSSSISGSTRSSRRR